MPARHAPSAKGARRAGIGFLALATFTLAVGVFGVIHGGNLAVGYRIDIALGALLLTLGFVILVYVAPRASGP
jgi:hypothetical protein